ncbi:hypothetical protein [Paenibacillus sabinae]|uniref:Uncharacterized protein n=1 Tax=Paenibacillus sabinae T27 TaxID=1268072 RepID=X4ZH60_9BACL|nr:hypothetical protein [Paenibacillus sabinae]AHV98821.1 hypothetical protein PSAB_19640 [Paenibacillus sabinae T27]
MNLKKHCRKICCNRCIPVFLIVMVLFALNPYPGIVSGEDAGVAKLQVQVGERKVLEQAAVPEQNENLNTVHNQYSTMTENGERKTILGEGIILSDYLKALGINLEEVEDIYLYWKEGAPAAFTGKELLETKRYHYTDQLKTEQDTSIAESGTVTEQTYNPSAGIEVPPMLALRSAVLNEPEENGDALDSTSGLRLCYGQQNPDEISSAMLKGNIQKIIVILKEDSTYGQKEPLPTEPDFKISIRVGTDDIKREIPFSFQQLEQFEKERQYYTSINEKGEPETTLAEGIPIIKLIESAGVDFNDVKNLRFFYADGLDSSFTKTFLFDRKRYSYPELVSGDLDDGEGRMIDKSKESQEVMPMLALRYAERTDKSLQGWDAISNKEGIKICYGQMKISDVVSPMYGYSINRMEIVVTSKINETEQAKTKTIDDNDVFGPAVSEETGDRLDELPTTLAFNVGYFGLEYLPRKIFSLEEIKSLPRVTQAYTAVDSSGKVVMETAVGVRLKDLLAAAGIDRNSVDKITFTFTENREKKRLSFSRGFLLDTPRYFYPNLPLRWNGSGPTAGAAVDALQVDTIIAFRDLQQQGATAPDFYKVNGYNRFKLIFGQTNTRSETVSRHVKWIDSVEIQLLGSPPDEKGNSVQNASLIGAKSKGTPSQQSQIPDKKLSSEATKETKATKDTEETKATKEPEAMEATAATEATGSSEVSQESLPESSNAKGVHIYEVNGMTEAQIPVARDHNAAVLFIAIGGLVLGGAGNRFKKYKGERG